MSEARDQNKFLVRMPDGMRERIAEKAKANNRSMNSEIVARLQTTLEMDDYVPGPNPNPDQRGGLFGLLDEDTLRRIISEELAKK